MQMEHGLPAVHACLRDDKVTAPVNPLLFGEFPRCPDEMSHQLLVPGFERV